MKLLFCLLLLSFSGNNGYDNGITYRALSWSDFKADPPENKRQVAAETFCQLLMEIQQKDLDTFTYAVKAYFVPDSSFVRVRSEYNLRHEQTHFKISYVAALRCNRQLEALQGGDIAAKEKAEQIFYNFSDQRDAENNAFDGETNHGLNVEQEKAWEMRVSMELIKLQTSTKANHGGSSKNR